MISSKQIILNGLLINYYQNEPKDAVQTVVFLHGWRAEAQTFNPILKILDEKNIKFYALDLPGFGRSNTPQNPFNLDDYVNIVSGFLEKISTKSVIVGHSFGGRIGIKLGSKRPDLVSKLVLVDSAGLRQESTIRDTKKWLARLLHPFFTPKFMQPLRMKIYRMMGAEDYLATPALQKTFVNVVSEDLSTHLSRILTPTLILWGENDSDTPLAFATQINTQIKDSKLVVFPKLGHFPFLDDPDGFSKVLLEFYMIRFIKNQWYLLQLENYNTAGFLNLILSGVFLRLKEYRNPLVYTSKLKTVIGLSLVLQVALAIFLSNSLIGFAIIFILTFVFHFVFLVVSVQLIWPVDFLLKQRIIRQAKNKLKTLPNLKIIGITGSFGKTTMKECLYAILSEKYRVLATPENINTPVGVSRLVLNQLKSDTEIFIVEMGAYQKGDIQILCEITPPDIAILTGINQAHLSRFGSIQNTIDTKFEIVTNSKPNALVVLNEDNDLVKQNANQFVSKKVVEWYGKSRKVPFQYQSSLLGGYADEVLSACFLIAKKLALTDDQIKSGIAKIKPIPHRLQLIPSTNGVTVIDDSYNGNPDGATEAIKVLKSFTNKRKFYITPGLVEMGKDSEEIHKKIGEQLAIAADKVILIQNSVTKYIAEGLKSVGFSEKNIIWFDSAPLAHAALEHILTSGDVILFQNDWPENYL